MTDSTPKIVFAEQYDDAAVERMRSIGSVILLDSCDERDLIASVKDCDALLVRSYAQITREVIARAGRLRVIGRGGVGLDNIDVQAAKKRGITVVHTPAAATDAAADLTVGLIIALTRKIAEGDAVVRAGRFAEGRSLVGPRELSELTLGIVGLGRIGRAVGRRCRLGFGMNILYNDIVAPGLLDFVATPLDKPRLYARSDIVSLHVPLTDQTHRLINEAAFVQFKPGAYLINTARGAVVDSGALAGALVSGRLGGAALDVFAPEPLPENHPLMQAPNTLFTPHIGARTARGLGRMNEVVADVILVLQGKEPRYRA